MIGPTSKGDVPITFRAARRPIATSYASPKANREPLQAARDAVRDFDLYQEDGPSISCLRDAIWALVEHAEATDH